MRSCLFLSFLFFSVVIFLMTLEDDDGNAINIQLLEGTQQHPLATILCDKRPFLVASRSTQQEERRRVVLHPFAHRTGIRRSGCAGTRHSQAFRRLRRRSLRRSGHTTLKRTLHDSDHALQRVSRRHVKGYVQVPLPAEH